jgi:hypothetical protein
MGRIVDQSWQMHQRAVTETGRAMFRNMLPVVRLRVLEPT